MYLMMKTTFKFGLICLVSTLVISACVKKEQPEQEQTNNETSVQNTAEQPVNTAQTQPQYTTLEEIPTEEPAAHISITNEQQTSISNENGQSDIQSNTTNTPTVIESKPSTAQSNTNNTAAIPAKPAASEDDAVAAALQAAQPALQ